MPTIRLSDVLAHTEALWPEEGAEEWDSVGLVTGSLEAEIKRILLVVDVTDATVSEAIDGKYDLIIAHHPLLLRGITTVAEDRYKGELIARLIRANCALLAVHTNGDRVESGTSAVLAEALDVSVSGAIVPNPLGGGIGVVGTINETTLGAFARRVASVLPATAGGVRVAGEFDAPVSTVSLCAGAGDGLLSSAAVRATDVYVTSDVRHHPASEFREQARLDSNTAIIDVSHWAAEWLWLDVASRELGSRLTGTTIVVSDINTDPWTFAVMQ